jgi:hypothetical protein
MRSFMAPISGLPTSSLCVWLGLRGNEIGGEEEWVCVAERKRGGRKGEGFKLAVVNVERGGERAIGRRRPGKSRIQSNGYEGISVSLVLVEGDVGGIGNSR